MSRDMDATKMFGTPNSVFNMPSYIKAETNHLREVQMALKMGIVNIHSVDQTMGDYCQTALQSFEYLHGRLVLATSSWLVKSRPF